jgi:hypothetical protein
VQKIKEERFKEEMGVFKILYERPFLQEYKNVMYAPLYRTGSAAVFAPSRAMCAVAALY